MTCEDCGERATVHCVRIVGNAQQELHLCRACADKRELIAKGQDFDLSAVMGQVVDKVNLLSYNLSKLECPDCGTRFAEFRKSGRLGCPCDYEVFRQALLPLLDRVHRATRHTGKRPRRAPASVGLKDEGRKLRLQLRQAIDHENYEEAARVRDLIHLKEHDHGS